MNKVKAVTGRVIEERISSCKILYLLVLLEDFINILVYKSDLQIRLIPV